MKPHRTFTASAFLQLALAVTLAGFGEAPVPPQLTQGQRAVAERRYAEALPLLEKELAADPGSTALLVAKTDALMGLGRFWEAGQTASSKMTAEPALRFRTAECLFALGRVADGAQLLSPLRKDAEWADRAYARLAWALLAVGQEENAKTMLEEGLAAAPSPAPAVLQAGLETDRDPKSILKTLDALDRADPSGASSRAGLRAVCAAAGEEAMEAAVLHADLPVQIALSETPVPEDPSGTVDGSPRMPRRPAPSAQRWGSGTYSRMPPGIKYYAEAEKTNKSASLLRCVVPVRFGDSEAVPMVLDTSATALLLSPSVAESLGLKSLGTGTTWTVGVAEPCALDLCLVPSLKLGPLEVKNVPALLLKDPAGVWKGLGGVMPGRLLRRYALHVDRAGGKLGLYPSGTRPEGILEPGCFRVMALWSSGMPFVKVGIQGGEGFMLLDGASNFTYLEPGVLREQGVGLATATYGTQNDRGHLGLISAGVAADLQLTLGKAAIHMPTVRVSGLAPPAPPKCSGILGRDVLRLFDLFVDYGANTVALRGYEKGR